MILHANIPMHLWVDVYLVATYLINRLSSITFANKSPYQCLCGRTPSYEGMKVIGCRCFPALRHSTQSKFLKKMYSCVFIGYSPQHKGY